MSAMNLVTKMQYGIPHRALTMVTKNTPDVASMKNYIESCLEITIRKIIGYHEIYDMDLYCEYDYHHYDVEVPKILEVVVKLSHGKSAVVKYDDSFEVFMKNAVMQ